MLCYVMLCYVMLCYVMLCYVMLCYVMLLKSGMVTFLPSYCCKALESHSNFCLELRKFPLLRL